MILQMALAADNNWRWYCGFVLSSCVLTLLHVLLLGHYAFNIPLNRLWQPAISMWGVVVVCAPLIYRGRTDARAHANTLGLLYFAIGLSIIGLVLLNDFWAWQLGIVEYQVAKGFGLTVLISGTPAVLIAYYVAKRSAKS
jgi:hypothetical protein